eukprot:CAMPEP_0118882794 /NCGR_PEP_ID=MMETSP1163-20130328/21978_1 /TAXON_ID=124430 /ORGANISM="Phaeomonas parva, Strain CCMP2877" /LENGTH=31 /DNA_ID= /DNA_START= /DNA_END= /DNA_ORIENTATION=
MILGLGACLLLTTMSPFAHATTSGSSRGAMK